MSPETRQLLREAVLRNRPWERSTGPRTFLGKARSAANGRYRQRGAKSVRELRGEVADVQGMTAAMAALRAALGSG